MTPKSICHRRTQKTVTSLTQTSSSIHNNCPQHLIKNTNQVEIKCSKTGQQWHDKMTSQQCKSLKLVSSNFKHAVMAMLSQTLLKWVFSSWQNLSETSIMTFVSLEFIREPPWGAIFGPMMSSCKDDHQSKQRMCENPKIGHRDLMPWSTNCTFDAHLIHASQQNDLQNTTKGSGLVTIQEPQLSLTDLQISMRALIVTQFKQLRPPWANCRLQLSSVPEVACATGGVSGNFDDVKIMSVCRVIATVCEVDQ
jgi:hypothetical protein